jgi:hypothetical protein
VVPQDILFEKYMARIGKSTAFVQNDPVCAIEHFEKSKEVLLQMGRSNDSASVLEVNILIASAKVKLPGVDKKAALANFFRSTFTQLSKLNSAEIICALFTLGRAWLQP